MYQRVPPPVDVKDTTGNTKPPENVPKNVPTSLWERFKVLEKKTDDITRRSTEKRIKYMKKSLMKKVEEEITLPDDRDILRQHDVKFGPPVHDEVPLKDSRKRKLDPTNNPGSSVSQSSTDTDRSWDDIKPYLTKDDHLKRPDKDRYKPETGLEVRINTAIQQGDYSKAEELSDNLSKREFGTKIAQAIDAHDFVKKRKEQEKSKTTRKKSNLYWGFQEKQRWETKSNM